jgi:ethanolamine-phosphate cytidylyltransferase
LLTFKQKGGDTDFNVDVDEKAGAKPNNEVKSHLSHFLPTSRRIMQFSNGQVWALKIACGLTVPCL